MVERNLPAELQPFIDAAIAMARKRLENGDELTGVAFIDAPSALTQAQALVAIPMSGAPSKNAWARMVQTVASLAEARFVVVASEIWLHEADSKQQLDKMLEEHHEVRLMPGRREAVLVQIETHDGLWQGIADVVPFAVATKPGCKTFGALDLKMPGHSEGRLVGLLGKRRGKPT